MATTPASLPFQLWLISKIWKSAVLPLSVRQDGTINRRVSDFFDAKVPPSEQPFNGVSSQDITIDETTDLWVRIFTPQASTTTTTKLPVVFYFHGGFFTFFTPASRGMDKLCRRIAQDCNSIVISVNYRRIPEHRYPAAIEDGCKIIKWFASPDDNSAIHPQQQQLLETADFSNTFLLGDSAGGNLVYNLSRRLAEDDDFRSENSSLQIRGQVLVQPSFGGEVATGSEERFGDGIVADRKFSDWRWKAYLPQGADKDHAGCNPFGNGSSSSSRSLSEIWIPPTLVVIGGFCPGQDRQRELVEKLKEAGKEAEAVFFPEAVHAFYYAPNYGGDIVSTFYEVVAKFIKSRCH